MYMGPVESTVKVNGCPTKVSSWAVLFAELLSGWSAVTVAVLVIIPSAVGATTIVMVLSALFIKDSRWQVTVPTDSAQLP